MNTIIHTRLDSNLKKDVEHILADIGLTVPDAIRLYFTQIRRKKAIPFVLTAGSETPQDWVLRACEEVQSGKGIKDIKDMDELKRLFEKA